MRSKILCKILGNCQYLDNILASGSKDKNSLRAAVFSFSKDQNDEFSFTQSVNQMHGIRSSEGEPSSSVRRRKLGISSMSEAVDPEDGLSTEVNRTESEEEDVRSMRELELEAINQLDNVIDEYALHEDISSTASETINQQIGVVEKTAGMSKSTTRKPDSGRYTTVSQEENSGSYEKEA